METGFILPDVEDVDTAPFWTAAREGRFVIQKCGSCGLLRFPPHPFCSSCRSEAVSWIETSGRGKIWSYVIHHNPTMPAYSPFAPFPVVVVELDEGPHLRITGNLVASPDAAINSVDPSTIRIGMPVKVVFRHIEDDVTLPYWMAA